MATATAEKQKKDATEVLDLKNMIGGEFVDPAEGKTEDVINPATGQVIAHSPVSTEEDVDRAVKAAREAFETWQYTTPSRAPAAAAEARRRVPGAGRGDHRLGDQGRRQAAAGDVRRGDPADGGSAPLLRRSRSDDGRARRGRVHGGPHLLHPSRAGRRGGADHPLELPADDGRLEDRPRARHRVHPHPEAGRNHPGDDAQDPGRAGGRDLSARRHELHRRPWRPRGLVAGDAPRGGHGLADGLSGNRQVDRRARSGHPEEGSPGARWQGTGDRLRRRRHGARDGDDRRDRLLQRRSRLHRGDARAGLEGRLRRRGLGPRRAGEGLQDRGHVRSRHGAGPGQLRAPARPRRGLPQGREWRRDRHRGQPPRPAGLLPRGDGGRGSRTRTTG